MTDATETPFADAFDNVDHPVEVTVSAAEVRPLFAQADAEIAALRSELDAARAEVARLRARVDVCEQDVDEADIGDLCSIEDSPKIVSWMRANGFEHEGRGDHRTRGIWYGDRFVLDSWNPRADDIVVNALAHAVGRPPLDVLDEMAAVLLSTDGSVTP